MLNGCCCSSLPSGNMGRAVHRRKAVATTYILLLLLLLPGRGCWDYWLLGLQWVSWTLDCWVTCVPVLPGFR